MARKPYDTAWHEKHRARLVERLRKIAAEAEAHGARAVAGDFRRQADEIEDARDPRKRRRSRKRK